MCLKNRILPIFLFLFYIQLSAQKEAYNWYFGNKAGITFNTNPPSALTNGQLNTIEGCATISTPEGRLLFYTDGIDVWDSTHNTMQNGSYLKGTNTTTQVSIVPRPDSPHIFYIFTVDYQGGSNGLRYSEVNMKLNSGRGAVVLSRKNIKLKSSVCEKVTVVQHSNGHDYWVLAVKYGSDSFFAYRITRSGLNYTPVAYKTGFIISTNSSNINTIGYLKVSPNGKKIAYANADLDSLAVGDFDASTGKITKLWVIHCDDAYAVEFSPRCQYLYIGEMHNKKVSQYDLSLSSKNAFASSRKVIDSAYSNWLGALQLGPDGKIYISVYYDTALSIIHAPDSMTFSCRPQKRFLPLYTKQAAVGLPNFIQSFFQKNTIKTSRNCLNDSAFFAISDIYNLDSVKWDFNDPKSGSKNISRKIVGAYHVYTQTGYYNVNLISYYKKVVDTIKVKIYIKNAKPDLGKDTSLCNKFIAVLKPSKDYLTYKWNNDSTSKALNISKKGVYILKVKDSVGCSSSDTIVVDNPQVKAAFILSDTLQCLSSNLFNVWDTSIYSNDAWKKSTWYFGDGSNSIDTNSRKTYADTGKFVIKLLVSTNGNCKDSISKSVMVLPSATIGFTINKTNQCFGGHHFDFTNTSTISQGSIVSYFWAFGDSTTSIQKNKSGKTYLQYGTYAVRLVTITDLNCMDTFVKLITIHEIPKAKFTVDKDKQCFKGNIFKFNNATSTSNDSIAWYNWSLGDGQSRTTENVSDYHFNNEDTFIIQLIVTSDKGCSDSTSQAVITFSQPIAKYQVLNDSQCWQNNFITIINQTTLKYGKLDHTWDFGDGALDSNFNPFPKKYPNKSAKYFLRYKVVSEHGCTDSLNHNITMLERPVSAFGINDSVQCFKNHLFNFTIKSTFSAPSTLTYYWDYGNGETSTGITPQTATYPKAQYYPVSLISYSSLTNCYDTFIRLVLPAPNALPDFLIDKVSQCLRFNRFAMSNLSTIEFGSMTYNWDFKDSTYSSSKNPVKYYTGNAGSYSVKLTVTTNYNCIDSIEKPLVLIPNPKAAFSINDTDQCWNKHAFNLTNTSIVSYGNLSNTWLFDDSTTDIGKDVSSKKFRTWGWHRIQLAINSVQNCTDTTEKMVYLEKPKSISIQLADNDSQCLRGNSFGFLATSSDPKINYTSYNWHFGDSGAAVTNPARHKYGSEGSMKTMLETISANGCKDSGYYTVQVHPHPVSLFTANSPCFPDAVILTNNSFISKGFITSFNWDFGNGATSIQANPVKKYNSPGYYKIQLIAISQFGCSDTLSKDSAGWLRPRPKAEFDFTTLPSKENLLTTLQMNNKSSVDAVSNSWDFGNGNTSKDRNPRADYKDSNNRLITLIVNNALNCKDTFSLPTGKLIGDIFLFMPNAFSPNANNINDEFKPVASPYLVSYVMQIYNRWGEKVFESRDLAKGWDGTYMGETCPQGVYLCRIYIVPTNGKAQSHEVTVTLMR